MGEIVNLRARRKAKERAEKERLAEQNRRHFGSSRTEREHSKLVSETEAKHLDGHRLADGQDGKPDVSDT